MEKYTEPFSPVYQDNILFFFFFGSMSLLL